MEITLSELQSHLDKANFRLHSKVMEISELSKLISNHTARELFERFKKAVTIEESVNNEEIRKLLCCIWVFYELGMIRFTKRTEGLVLTIQEMILNNKKTLAARLVPILEHVTEYISNVRVSIK